MVVRGTPTSPVLQRWLLRSVLVCGAVGAFVLVGGAAHGAETPATPTAGLRTDIASGTVSAAVGPVEPAPVIGSAVRAVRVVGDLPGAVDGVVPGARDAVREPVTRVADAVDPVAAPVVGRVDTVVVEVVEHSPGPEEVRPVGGTGVVADPAPVSGSASATYSPRSAENARAATILGPFAGEPTSGSVGRVVGQPTGGASSPPASAAVGRTAKELPAVPAPADRPGLPAGATPSPHGSSSGGPSGPDLTASAGGSASLVLAPRAGLPPGHDQTPAAAGATTPPFSPD